MLILVGCLVRAKLDWWPTSTGRASGPGVDQPASEVGDGGPILRCRDPPSRQGGDAYAGTGSGSGAAEPVRRAGRGRARASRPDGGASSGDPAPVIVLATNVVSELMRPSPDPRVTVWAEGQIPAEVVTSAVTVAEIGHGIARLPGSRRRDLLAVTAEEVFGAFATRVLPFDASAAPYYAGIVVARERRGRRSADSMRRSPRSAVPVARDWRPGTPPTSPNSIWT